MVVPIAGIDVRSAGLAFRVGRWRWWYSRLCQSWYFNSLCQTNGLVGSVLSLAWGLAFGALILLGSYHLSKGDGRLLLGNAHHLLLSVCFSRC